MQRRVFFGAAAALAGLSASDGPADLERVAVGTVAPAFEIPNGDNRPISLGSLRGQRVVVIFYRGQW